MMIGILFAPASFALSRLLKNNLSIHRDLAGIEEEEEEKLFCVRVNTKIHKSAQLYLQYHFQTAPSPPGTAGKTWTTTSCCRRFYYYYHFYYWLFE
jgi:hypothetical protein